MDEGPTDMQPRPGLRRGPRPLLLHLMLATLKSNGSPNTWPRLNDDWTHWIARLCQSGSLANPFEPPPIDAALLSGIAAYRRHPAIRDVTDPPAIWCEGGSRLLDYGGTGPVLLLVPSLINRGYVLDLSSDRSMVRFLARSGLRVVLLDWGWPGEIERQLDLDALITGRLARAIGFLRGRLRSRLVLAGYCMGGLLAMAAAQRQAEDVKALALLATPWNFQAGDPSLADACKQVLEAMEPVMAMSGSLPIDTLQALFSVGDPQGVGNKYRGFATADQTSGRARQFVLIEDWLNDGVPLAAPVARDCLGGWYGRNTPAHGEWMVGGAAVDPTLVCMPSFVAVPGRDRIVPPESALPLAAALPDATVIHPAAGHIGMVAGGNAEAVLWQPLAEWAKSVGGRE